MNTKLIIIVVIFLLGFYYFTNYGSVEAFGKVEAFGNLSNVRCPNILIQKGNDFYLYNSKIAEVPGVNPLRFSNLEEYVEFTKWQRSQGIICPILYVQESYDAQGNRVFKARPSPTNLLGGLPDMNMDPSGLGVNIYRELNQDESKLFDAGHDDGDYNKNSLPGFDPQGQYIGLETPLDKMFNEAKGSISPNPMDPNWGGAAYTQSLIDQGYYKGNEVVIATA
jgi:hypothetical protein